MLLRFFLTVLTVIIINIKCQNYQNQGKDWTQGECSKGLEQSPINFNSSETQYVENNHLYMIFKDEFQTLKVKGDGETLIIEGDFLDFYVVDFENKLRFYQSQSLHIHSYAEHTIDNTRADMELHVVCQETETSININGVNKRPFGSIAFMFNQSNEQDNPIFNQINIDHLNQEISINFLQTFGQMLYDKQYQNEKKLQFFAYQGSFTSHNCSETLNHYFIDEYFKIGVEQLENFRKLFVDNYIYYNNSLGNFRYIQPLNNRSVISGQIYLTDLLFSKNIFINTIAIIILLISIIIN